MGVAGGSRAPFPRPHVHVSSLPRQFWMPGDKAAVVKLGQYRFLSYMGCDDDDSAVKSLSQRVMSKIRKLARCVSTGSDASKLFWVSKLLDTTYASVDDKITACLVREIRGIDHGHYTGGQRRWRLVPRGPFLKLLAVPEFSITFISFVGELHLIAEVYLNDAPAAASSTSGDDDAAALADLSDICRKLSNYMLYLVVAHPASASLLQVTAGNPQDLMEAFARRFQGSDKKDAILSEGRSRMQALGLLLNWTDYYKEALEELRDLWVRLLLYAAGNSRPAAHATQLARGGAVLLTFVWLLMVHYCLRNSSGGNPIGLRQPKPGAKESFPVIYVVDEIDDGA